jgi:hypothetical protein
VLSVACLAVIVAVTDLLAGFGHDLHVLRMGVTLCVLLPTMLIVVLPGQSSRVRLQAFAIAFVLAPMAWWRVPCRGGGPYLLQAGIQRDAMLKWLDMLPPDDVKPLPRIRESLEALAADYPTLCEEARATVDGRVTEVVAARMKDLQELSGSDAVGFTKTAPARRLIAETFPGARVALRDAEAKWAVRWANFTAVGYTEADMSPLFVREGLRNSERQLMDLPGLDDTPERFLEARRALFREAHAVVEKEITALHAAHHFDRAFGIALAHRMEWKLLPGLLRPEDESGLNTLVERCRSRLIQGGDPELIPAPRAIEVGPVPRIKAQGDTP